jgi:hypothetical protein
MIPHDKYAAAVRGNDPELAFVHLESEYRDVFNKKLEDSDNSNSYDAYVIEYMNHTIAAARALELHILDQWTIPSHSSHGLHDLFRDFTTAVDHFKVQVQIDHARSHNRFSVVLDTTEKDKLRNYVAQIKRVIGDSSLPLPKKERLYDKINNFLAEVDRDRTPYEQFADLVINLAHLGGEAAQELEPARKLINSIARLLGRNKQFEDSEPRLPPAPKPRQIPSPPKGLPPPQKKRGDMDDEIPF